MAKLGYTWYPKDWGNSDSVFELNLSERGLYRELIDLAMLSDNKSEYKPKIWARKFGATEDEINDIINKLASLNLIQIQEQYVFIPSCESRLNLVRGGSKGGSTSKPTPKPTMKPTPKPNESLDEKNEKPIANQIEREREIESKREKENNIEERKLKFASTLKPFVKEYGKDMIFNFYRYWTEHNKSNTKFKYELEKTWNLERRLDTWHRKDYSKNNKAETKIQRWKDPSEVYLCTDWIKRIPKPPNLNDDEACMDFIIKWNIRELRKYQYEQTGTTNQIADYEE